MFIQNQLLATKFFVPVASHPLISRPRLNALLQESLNHPLTLISTPAGFGKTMLLSAWGQSLPPSRALLAWLSLDEEDNEPQQFWLNVLTALSMHQPERFTPLLKYLQSPQTPPLKYVLTALVNLLVDRTEHIVLILDDYHLITEPQVHTTLAYLVEHLPSQLHIILATRTDPPLPLSLLQTREQVLQIRTNQLCCTPEETKAFLQEVMGVQLPDETIREVTTRTEGWLVGLQLLGLSLPGHPDPATLLEELRGDQRYILDFLIEEVLQRQPQEVQTFLLSTSILECFTASLCDTVLEQAGSQQMLEWLERANLFVVSLDSKRQWYRYHVMFAEALRYRLEHTHADLVPILHHRASLWYAKHNQTTQAILHAFSAHQWQWAADLIERLPLLSLTWGASQHELVLFRQWLEQLPADIVRSRPRLCLACAQMLWITISPAQLQVWLDMAETTLTASLMKQSHEDVSDSVLTLRERREQENLLGEVIDFRAFLLNFQDDGPTILSLCQRAFSLLSGENALARAHLAFSQAVAYYTSANDTVAAIESGLYGSKVAQEAGYTALAISIMGTTVYFMIGAGQLSEAYQLAQRAIDLGTQPGGFILPDVGWPTLWQAEILREWNQLDTARALVEEAILLCQQIGSIHSHMYILCGYAVLLRVHLSRRDLEAARSALEEFERIGKNMNEHVCDHVRSLFTTIDQVRLCLACGELNHAIHWAEELELKERHITPFELERQKVAHTRILLAAGQPTLALQRLELVLARATAGQRWNHVIEIQLLQTLAHQMCHYGEEALSTLSEAVHLTEPENYICRFVDESASLAALLSKLQEEQRKQGPTPYLSKILEAFSLQDRMNGGMGVDYYYSGKLLAAFALQSKGYKLQLEQSLPFDSDEISVPAIRQERSEAHDTDRSGRDSSYSAGTLTHSNVALTNEAHDDRSQTASERLFEERSLGKASLAFSGQLDRPFQTSSQVPQAPLSLFAVASIALEEGDRALVEKPYSIQAGISQFKPEDFAAEPFDLSLDNLSEPIWFDILLHASDNIEIIGDWQQRLCYDLHNSDLQLVSFPFRPLTLGKSHLVVNFYRERRWLKTIRLEFTTVDQFHFISDGSRR